MYDAEASGTLSDKVIIDYHFMEYRKQGGELPYPEFAHVFADQVIDVYNTNSKPIPPTSITPGMHVRYPVGVRPREVTKVEDKEDPENVSYRVVRGSRGPCKVLEFTDGQRWVVGKYDYVVVANPDTDPSVYDFKFNDELGELYYV